MKAMQSWKRLCRGAAQMFIAVLLTIAYGEAARAQTASPSHAQAPVSQFDVASTPYRLTWDGTTGGFQREALGNLTPMQMKMTYLHTDPGPRGYAKYLAWFLARN